MTNSMLPNIPRFYTALAEWGACMVYLIALSRRINGWRFGIAAASALIIQSFVLIMTGDLSIGFWIPCMAAAVILMFLFLYFCGNLKLVDTGYFCARAFVLAEFAASFEWQMYCYFWPMNNAPQFIKILLLISVYSIIFFLALWLEKRYMPGDLLLGITLKELWSVIIIGCAAFTVSNLSFVTIHTPFSGEYGRDILNIRTMVDFGGLAILYAYHLRSCELRIRQELKAVQFVLQNQYIQYQQSKESIDIVNRKYHDLKHQLMVLRVEPDSVKRNTYLDQMENEIKIYEAQNKTGNVVLDTLLTSKSMHCIAHNISLNCVADGELLGFMDVMDICTIFGNALDNAIEFAEKIPEEEKRLIHVTVSSQKGFLIIRCENYYEGSLNFKGGLPATTKKDAVFHGYGLKSIRYVSHKYGGTMTVEVQNNWFDLKILIPRAV